jgi:ribonuclease HII
VKGDGKVACIAAASILAKVSRDFEMMELAEEYPGYGFEIHKGYGTPAHLTAIEKLGPSPIHRMSFAPLKKS